MRFVRPLFLYMLWNTNLELFVEVWPSANNDGHRN